MPFSVEDIVKGMVLQGNLKIDGRVLKKLLEMMLNLW
jgi:hypothetical protein